MIQNLNQMSFQKFGTLLPDRNKGASVADDAKKLTLDLEKVLYVSSAGLRAFLIGQKTAASKGAAMELTHVAPAVKTVLDSVGFSKILTIR
jgi:anti-anti-sigma factor